VRSKSAWTRSRQDRTGRDWAGLPFHAGRRNGRALGAGSADWGQATARQGSARRRGSLRPDITK
jgi:hypothetical protein